GWQRIGVLDSEQLPFDLRRELEAGAIALEHVASDPYGEVDEWDIAMYRKAARLARERLEEAVGTGVSVLDREFVGKLEREYRLAGAEDVEVFVTNGDSVPRPAAGVRLERGFSAAVSLEYRGHWVRVTRTHPRNDALHNLFQTAMRYQMPGPGVVI